MRLKDIRRVLLWLPVFFGPDWLVSRLARSERYLRLLEGKGWFGL